MVPQGLSPAGERQLRGENGAGSIVASTQAGHLPLLRNTRSILPAGGALTCTEPLFVLSVLRGTLRPVPKQWHRHPALPAALSEDALCSPWSVVPILLFVNLQSVEHTTL